MHLSANSMLLNNARTITKKLKVSAHLLFPLAISLCSASTDRSLARETVSNSFLGNPPIPGLSGSNEDSSRLIPFTPVEDFNLQQMCHVMFSLRMKDMQEGSIRKTMYTSYNSVLQQNSTVSNIIISGNNLRTDNINM